MAMIYCPECGKQVSDKATACPNCGCPVDAYIEVEQPKTVVNPKYSNPSAYICIIGGILAVIGCLLPFASISLLGSTQSVNFFDASNSSFVVLGAMLLGTVCAIPKKGKQYILPFIAGLVSVILSFTAFDEVKDRVGELSHLVEEGEGFYLIVCGGIAMVIGAVVANANGRK